MLSIIILSDALSIVILERSSESTVKLKQLDSGSSFDYMSGRVHSVGLESSHAAVRGLFCMSSHMALCSSTEKTSAVYSSGLLLKFTSKLIYDRKHDTFPTDSPISKSRKCFCISHP